MAYLAPFGQWSVHYDLPEGRQAPTRPLETGNLNSFNKATADKLATIFDIPVYDLLAGYNRFLCDGQAKRIKEYRASFCLGQKLFARQMGIPIRCLQDWESGRKVVSLKSWEKYFKDRIST